VSPLALVFILFAFAAIGFIVARSVRRPAAADAEHPTCGRCDYIVRGIEGFICPECGGDLREVGIIPPGGRKPMGRAMRVFRWSAVAAPTGIFLGLILTPLVPQDTPWSDVVPFAIAAAIWLLGLPLLLRRRRDAARVESPRDADEA
jgi:hypothetical protein